MPEKDFTTEIRELSEAGFFDYLPRIIKLSFSHKTNIKRLRVILKGKKFVVLAIPLFFYLTLSMGLLLGFGYFHRRISIMGIFYFGSLGFLAWLAATVIKRGISHWVNRIITPSEKDYQQDIEGFLRSIEPLLGKNKTLELPKILKIKNPLSLAELFTKRLIPENICLVLIDQSQDKFSVRASMGLNQDLVSRAAFSPDSRLIFWLKKLSKDLNKEELSELLPKDREGKTRYEDIEKIKQEMALTQAEVCSQIYHSLTVFVGFLSLGKKLIGKYTPDELATLPYLTRELGMAMLDTSFKMLEEEKYVIEFIKKLLNEMVIEEAKMIATGEDEKIWETLPLTVRIWHRFEKEIHTDGLTPETKDLMLKNYGLDLPVSFRLERGLHGKKVTFYLISLVKELGLEEKIKPYTHEDHIFWLKHQTEWYDGTGYPEGIRGEEIPLLARITAIAEALDIFYQAFKDMDKALNAISRFSGTKFDSEIVKALKSVCEKGVLLRYRTQNYIDRGF